MNFYAGNITLNMIMSYPQWRKILISDLNGLERCLHFLMEAHSYSDLNKTH